jgi:hypothetical protein
LVGKAEKQGIKIYKTASVIATKAFPFAEYKILGNGQKTNRKISR